MQTTRGTSLSESSDQSTTGAASTDGQPLRPSTSRIALLAGVAIFVIVADLVSKLAVVAHMQMYEVHDVVGGLLRITYTRNAGAAFSFGEGMTAVFGLVAVAVAVAIVRTARNLRSLTWAIVLGLLLGGALGNLGDRVFRSPGFLRGHVVDWIELPHWPVFNLADSAIVCGGILAVLLSWRGIAVDGSHHGHHRAASGDDDTRESNVTVLPARPAESAAEASDTAERDAATDVRPAGAEVVEP
jgi:signal peptidase II